MRVGITGCAGFIGSHLVDGLLERGHFVVGLDNLSMGKMENIEHNLENPRFLFRMGDIRDSGTVFDTFAKSEVIVHLAAFKIPRYGNELETLQINSLGTHNILEAARNWNCKVVLASTSDVYGKSAELPFREDGDLVLGPSTIARWGYAVTKIFDEHLSLAYQEKYGIPVVNLRFFGSYGPRQHLSWWGGPQSVFISQVLEGKKITIHGDGQQTRSFTYVSDTIDGIVAATEKLQANGQIFNIGSNREISILELAKLIHRMCETGCELKIEFVPYMSLSGRKYEDVMRRIPDNSKARALLGVEPKVGLEEGLHLTIEWQRAVMSSTKTCINVFARIGR